MVAAGAAMFSLTFLGHQGWLISTPTTRLLVDPLLTEGFGHGGLLGRVYPPRRLDLAEFPAIDAVLLSHEHDDHFDVPSLARIDRAIPIYLSSRSSLAAHGLLAEMGFVVHPVEPEASLQIGDLHYRSFLCDHREGGQGDEWDVFPMWIGDLAGHGSLLSSIDVATPVLGLERGPSVWIHAHNSTRTEFQRLRPPAAGASSTDAASLIAAVLRRFALIEGCYGPPAAALICGQGWSFFGERRWINHEAFPVAPERLAEALALASPATRALAPAPGLTLEFVDGRLVGVREGLDGCAALPREAWPDRSFAPSSTAREYSPACGRVRLDAGELDELLAELEDLARYLYGTAVFRELCSLPNEVAGVAAAVGFSLRVDDSERRVVVRYEPGGCRFVIEEVGADPQRSLASGIECYATDLLAFLRGEIGPSALCYAGRVRTWNRAADRLYFSPHELWLYGHPLRRPAHAARLYRRLLAAQPEDAPRLPARAQPVAAL